MERWSCDGDGGGGAGGGFWVDTVAAAVDGVSHFREAKLWALFHYFLIYFISF